MGSRNASPQLYTSFLISTVKNIFDSIRKFLFSFDFNETTNESKKNPTWKHESIQVLPHMNVLPKSHGLQTFSSEQLSFFDGSRPSKDVYLAFLGRVYNVQKGYKHYGPGGGYHFFAGKDATRAFVTGEFSEAGLTDDVSDLNQQDLLGLLEWSNFYEKEYVLVGFLQGTYYDAHGMPTKRLKEVLGLIEDATHWKAAQVQEVEVFPPCNSEWHKDNGGRVWCSTKSGGIHRSWSGVPRKLFSPGTKTYRCACVKNFGAPLAGNVGNEKGTNRGDLDNPNLHEYEGCGPTANSCKILEI
ncbi:unnamed protein product [Dracunculus medinensis]|uniref:Cytochrome b5 heme-binding domain-containing protein n=1 Tax=Dracunculus medinensis TaxID=318479 RepID=A0A0N4UAB0_DRAME|nr:unnamed protein product [Dracunculus medinensis]